MITEKFKTEYGKLNARQKEAVDTIEGPVMVIAGPGTGKTTILTLRIANILLKTDTPASGILALTFTEAGAKNMRKKLREIIGDRALEVPIHTFHAFAAKVIAEFGDHFPQLGRSNQITEIESEKLLREILKEKKFSKLRPLGDPDFYIAKILATISDAKQEAWTPAMLKSFAESEIERIKNDPTAISTRGQSKGELKGEALRRIEKCERTKILSEVYEIYESRKKAEKKIDFDDLIFELLKNLREDKLLLQILQERYLYILLDEHQDTNDAQNMIVRTIADFFEAPNLFVVGDEKQAIYRFQGASVENFLSFQKIWSQMKVIFLSDNYRSHQYILDATFQMIEKNYEENEHQNLRVKLKSGANIKSEPLEIIIAPDQETEEAYLVTRLAELTKKDPVATIAIIVRKNSEVAQIFSLLEENNIRASAERGANIFSHPLGNLYFSLLEFLINPSSFEALSETLALGLWGLDFEKQTRLIRFARSGHLNEIEKEIPIISKLQKEINNCGALQFLYLSADLSGFTEIAIKSPLSVEVWRGIISLAEELVKAHNLENPKVLIQELLDYKKSADRRVIKINTGSITSQITIMTAHGSKGLEFDYVFLPFANEENWIRKSYGSFFVLPKEKEGNDDLRDERRLFYVSLTRAKKHAVISFAHTPLRFIDELDQNFISATELSKTTKARAVSNLAKIKAKQNLEQQEYAKNVLLQNGLSVTALNHFLECPNKFFYKSILKLPEPPTASSEKGTAMHEAMACVWNKQHKEIGDIQNDIKTTVQNYFKNSLLSAFEKEACVEELVASALKVAIVLKEHFSQADKVSVESWVENNFPLVYEKEKLEIKLHGRLDVVIEQDLPVQAGNKVLVFDYKTREAMSVNAIKGETKSSQEQNNGNYFRQLVFYKMLLENKNKIIEPALVFIKPDSKGRCPTITLPIEKSDVTKVETEITNLLQSVWSGEFLSQTCDDKTCQYCGYRKLHT